VLSANRNRFNHGGEQCHYRTVRWSLSMRAVRRVRSMSARHASSGQS